MAILAGGPSLSAGQVATVRAAHKSGACRAIVVNNAYRPAPWSDLLYACDFKWWEKYRPEFAGIKVTQDARVAGLRGDVLRVPCKADGAGLSFDPLRIHGGGNGGFQALNLALLLGAARILLLGVDLGAASDGRRHHYPDHPAGMNNPDEGNFRGWRAAFEAAGDQLLARGIDAVNCNPAGALAGMAGYRTADPEEVLL